MNFGATGSFGLLGPVSQVLENELRQKVRRHGLVIWLDANTTYSHLVDRLQVMRTAGEFIPQELTPEEQHAISGTPPLADADDTPAVTEDIW